MHTPIPENSRLYSQRSNGDAAVSSGAQNQGNTRSSIKGPRRKMSVTDATLAPRQPRKTRQELAARGWMDGPAEFLVRNQIRMSLGLLTILAATHLLLPHQRPMIKKFYSASYYNPKTGLYSKGLDDLYLVFFWIVVFTFLRSALLDYVFVPLARCGGITTRKGVVRFSEQAWMVVSYGAFWSVGMHLIYRSPYWFNMEEMWTDWPLKDISGLFKWYYLAQFGFWLQQIFVLNIEERRKDHAQMFAHHIITCALIAASYTHHMMRVGHVILCIMDVIDILLSAAKLLKYLGYSTICDYAFGIFLVAWIVGRHGMYNWIVQSVWADSVRIIVPGCYGPEGLIPGRIASMRTLLNTFTFQSDIVCFTVPVQHTFVVLLVLLQLLMVAWLYMILRVAWKVVRGGRADDTRSEDEDEDEDEDEGENEDRVCDDLDEKTKLPAGGPSPDGIVKMAGTLTR